MSEEIWKDIENYEGKYMVSNQGRVKTLNYKQTGKEKILKPGNNGRGYLFVRLCLNGKVQQYRIHRLVANAYIQNPNNFPQINHIDENKQNNCVNNLEWCSAKYNNCYGTRIERVSKKVGCYRDNKLIKVYNTIRDVDKDGFYHGNVIKCCKGKLKSSGGFTWRYID